MYFDDEVLENEESSEAVEEAPEGVEIEDEAVEELPGEEIPAE